MGKGMGYSIARGPEFFFSVHFECECDMYGVNAVSILVCRLTDMTVRGQDEPLGVRHPRFLP